MVRVVVKKYTILRHLRQGLSPNQIAAFPLSTPESRKKTKLTWRETNATLGFPVEEVLSLGSQRWQGTYFKTSACLCVGRPRPTLFVWPGQDESSPKSCSIASQADFPCVLSMLSPRVVLSAGVTTSLEVLRTAIAVG